MGMEAAEVTAQPSRCCAAARIGSLADRAARQ
jgi:hypothetical protein